MTNTPSYPRRPQLVGLLAVIGLLAVPVAALPAASVNPPPGQYFFEHGTGENNLSGAFVLHGTATITAVGVTTNLIACVRPPSTKVQFPGPPFNWQPQKTIPVHRSGPNLIFSYSGSFHDRINGYPETMTIHGTITPHGTVTGAVSLTEDDTTAATGEIKCHTRALVPFTGKHG